MKLDKFEHFVLLALALTLQPPLNAVAQDNTPTAFVNVNVIPIDTERVLENQTVIVRGDRIMKIGAVDEITVPSGAQTIEGNGAYLMPGLADMHTHIALSNPDPEHLVLYLAEGTTTIRSVGEAPQSLSLRERVKRNELVSPTIYSTGRVIIGNHNDYLGFGRFMKAFRILIFFAPLVIGAIVYFLWKRMRNRRTLVIGIPSTLLLGLVLTLTNTPSFMVLEPILFPEFSNAGFVSESSSQAVEEVNNQYGQKVDAVKLYDGLAEEQFLAAATEAKERGMYVISHLPEEMSLETILTSGTDEVAHLDEFNSHHWTKTPDEVMDDFRNNIDPQLDYTLIPRTVELVKENNVAVVSNMSLDEIAYKLVLDTPAVLSGQEYRIIRPEVLENWRTQGRPITKWKNQGRYRKNEIPFFKKLIKSLHEAGVLITTGTDCSYMVEGAVPEQIHRELELLVEAGLSNYEALKAGTRNAGSIVNKMGRDGNFGSVVVGQRADLVLLKENPLENVSHTRNRIGVMARGQWFTQTELHEMVDEFIDTFSQSDNDVTLKPPTSTRKD